MAQQVGVEAAGLFKSIGQHRQLVEGRLAGDEGREVAGGAVVRRQPARGGGDRLERGKDVPEQVARAAHRVPPPLGPFSREEQRTGGLCGGLRLRGGG